MNPKISRSSKNPASPTMKLRIVQLFPQDMNIYGDWGNILTIKRRLEWRNIAVEIIDYNRGDSFPQKADIIIGGGGQDAGQYKIHKPLLKITPQIIEHANDGKPILVICGLYQLFGHSFTTSDGKTLQGIGLFDAITRAGAQRLIGNIATDSEAFGTIVGYENHSGLTYLGSKANRLATVISGHGNNGEDGSEGIHYKHAIGSYLHGSLLPKNPKIADYLIEHALKNKYGENITLKKLDDTTAAKARESARKRPR